MKIFSAIGFGIFLVVLSLLMPRVLAELTNTTVIFLQSSAQAFSAAGQLASQAGKIQISSH